MKKLFLLFLLPSVLFAQTHLSENFSGTFPPAGWIISAQPGNWSAVSSTISGGQAPEARFSWTPQFNGESRFISPVINLTGVANLRLEFRHSIDHYGGSYTVGVATRSGGGAWNIVWSKVNPTASIPGTLESIVINNTDVGASDFQICWYFSGSSYNINYWYLDDIKLFTPLAFDAKVKEILVSTQHIPGSVISPQAIVTNFGTQTISFTSTCVIKQNGTEIYNQESAFVTLNPDQDITVTFPDITLSAADEIYEVTVKTNLAGDMDPTNDLLTKDVNTYTTEKNIVILEIGTGTWCTYCPGASMGAHDLLVNGKKVGVIKYHNNDSFTNSYSNARNNYYGITGYPTAVFDGVHKFIGGSNTQSMYANYLPLYEDRVGINAPFQVQIFGINSGLNYSITVLVSRNGNLPPSLNNLVLHLVLTESNIPFNWQGQTHVHNAERLMAPNENGTTLDFSSGNHQHIELNFSINQNWVINNLELVSFIQNLDNKEILQGRNIMINQLVPVPVELTSFTANKIQGGVLLEWTTASEVNNLGFEIERSVEGSPFITVGFIDGKGTTTEQQKYSYFDKVEYNGNQSTNYRLKQVDFDGHTSYSDIVEVKFDIPVEFILHQNYPNPFNPSTKITFALPVEEFVTLKVFDMLGKEVASLINEKKPAGTYETNFNATGLASGVYIYKLSAGSYTSTMKMTILR